MNYPISFHENFSNQQLIKNSHTNDSNEQCLKDTDINNCSSNLNLQNNESLKAELSNGKNLKKIKFKDYKISSYKFFVLEMKFKFIFNNLFICQKIFNL